MIESLKRPILPLMMLVLLSANASANSWLVGCHPNGVFLAEAEVGPQMMMDLPGYLYSNQIVYDPASEYSNVTEGFTAGYVHVDILFAQYDPAEALGTVLIGRGITEDKTPLTVYRNPYNLPVAYYCAGQDCVGVCGFGINTIVVSVDTESFINGQTQTLENILDSIHPRGS